MYSRHPAAQSEGESTIATARISPPPKTALPNNNATSKKESAEVAIGNVKSLKPMSIMEQLNRMEAEGTPRFLAAATADTTCANAANGITAVPLICILYDCSCNSSRMYLVVYASIVSGTRG